MVALNSKSEVADFLDVSQFQAGRSAYECVAYSASLMKFCGQPGHGPTGSILEASNLAQYYYGLEEGSNLASNTNGMSLEAEYDMLKRMGLHYEACAANVLAVKEALQKGYPLIICGAETGMHDLELGNAVPYSWTPTGNHAIVASGIASDGNLLVHDCASISSSGVRPGPRRYDASKLQLVSATAIIPSWLEDTVIDINMPVISAYFTLVNDNQWQRKNAPNGKVIILHGDMLKYYQTCGTKPYCGLSQAGLPESNEIPIEQFGSEFAHLAGSGIVVVYLERQPWIYDPKHLIDNPPGAGTVYPLHLYQLPGQDPLVGVLQKRVADLQAQLTQQQQAPDPIAAIHAVQAAVAPFK